MGGREGGRASRETEREGVRERLYSGLWEILLDGGDASNVKQIFSLVYFFIL